MPYLIFADLGSMAPDVGSEPRRAAERALRALEARQAVLVVCSSATRAEVEVLSSELGIRGSFIVENGGAILIPAGFFPFAVASSTREGLYDVIRLGMPYTEIVAGLRRAAETSQCPIRGFYDMPVDEVAQAGRMDLQGAARAKQREYDEPFRILDNRATRISALLEQIEKEGLSWTRGKGFYHARGRHNKGQAAKTLASLYRRLQPDIVTVGIGEGPNDLSLLNGVDMPVLQPRGKRWSDAILDLLQRSNHLRRPEAGKTLGTGK